jgi:hypothetical protein
VTRIRLLAVAALVAFGLVPSAGAKDFRPGDLRVCSASRCIAIRNPDAVRLLGPFYYGAASPAIAPRPRLGAPSFELRFPNGYATGIVATARLDRFLSYGVHIGHFQRDVWYRVPPVLSEELRKLTAALRPLPLTKAALARSR